MTPIPKRNGAGFQGLIYHSPLQEGDNIAESVEFGKHFPNCVPQTAGSVRC